MRPGFGHALGHTMLLVGGLALAVCGCTTGYAVRMGASSHFIPPTARTTELGPVKATVSGGGGFLFWLPDLETSAQDQKLLNTALQTNPGAETIIDYIITARVQSIWLLIIPFVHWSTLDVEGTAARIETTDVHSLH